MKTIFLYFLPFVIVAGCFQIFEPGTQAAHDYLCPASGQFIKAGTQDGSSANINQVDVVVNVSVVKKLFFSLSSVLVEKQISLSIRNLCFRFSSRLYSYQTLYLSHRFLLL